MTGRDFRERANINFKLLLRTPRLVLRKNGRALKNR